MKTGQVVGRQRLGHGPGWGASSNPSGPSSTWDGAQGSALQRRPGRRV